MTEEGTILTKLAKLKRKVVERTGCPRLFLVLGVDPLLELYAEVKAQSGKGSGYVYVASWDGMPIISVKHPDWRDFIAIITESTVAGVLMGTYDIEWMEGSLDYEKSMDD